VLTEPRRMFERLQPAHGPGPLPRAHQAG
jgi:hypothetical protein